MLEENRLPHNKIIKHCELSEAFKANVIESELNILVNEYEFHCGYSKQDAKLAARLTIEFDEF